MWKYIFYIFLAYSLYQLIFKFIIPVYRTTRQVKKSFREMQERMNGQMNGQNSQRPAANTAVNQPQANTGEYIDFEEVKD